jgi:hypothetical protein
MPLYVGGVEMSVLGELVGWIISYKRMRGGKGVVEC